MAAGAGSARRGARRLVAAAVAAALTGCTLPPPAPADAEAAPPRRDEAACRSLAASAPEGVGTLAEQHARSRAGVVLAAQAGAGPVGTSSTPPDAVPTRQEVYARCIRSGRG